MRSSLILLSVVTFLGLGTARAQLSMEHSASVLIYPRVVADDVSDTYIELANSANSLVRAHCFYVSSATSGSLVEEFQVSIPKAMSTHWVVSTGRPLDPSDTPCAVENSNCDGAGIDPGSIPPMAGGFHGELVCVEVDSSGSPFAGNHFLGSATQIDRSTGDVTRYAALGARGTENVDGDPVLCLGDAGNPPCTFGMEYDPCPSIWLLEMRPDSAEIADAQSRSSLTIVPCNQNLATGVMTAVEVQVRALTALGMSFEAVLPIEAWTDVDLSAIDVGLSAAMLGDGVAQLRIRSTDGHGLFVLGGERREGNGRAAVAVQAGHVGIASAADLITLPSLQEQPGGVGARGASR